MEDIVICVKIFHSIFSTLNYVQMISRILDKPVALILPWLIAVYYKWTAKQTRCLTGILSGWLEALSLELEALRGCFCSSSRNGGTVAAQKDPWDHSQSFQHTQKGEERRRKNGKWYKKSHVFSFSSKANGKSALMCNKSYINYCCSKTWKLISF